MDAFTNAMQYPVDSPNFAQLLQGLVAQQSPETQPAPMQQTMAAQSAMPEVDPRGLSDKIQQWLGASQAPTGGKANDLLAARFAPKSDFAPQMSDVTGALGKSLSTGEYASPEAYNIERLLGQSKVDVNNAIAQTGGVKPGATMQAFALIKASHPEIDDLTALSMAKSGVGVGNTYNNGVIQNIPGAPQAASNIKYAETTGNKTAETDVERRAGFTKAQSALRGFEANSQLVMNNIDSAIKTIDAGGATGWSYKLGHSLPNTNARALDNYLTTIKANLGFDKLQSMRDNSPTGGALGQISDFENKLLQAVNGALDPLQGDQLKENLQTIKTLYPQVLAERQRSFNQDYGNVTPIGNNTQQPPAAPVFPGQNFNAALTNPPVNSATPNNVPTDARQAPDGNFYVPDPQRPGKYLQVVQ